MLTLPLLLALVAQPAAPDDWNRYQEPIEKLVSFLCTGKYKDAENTFDDAMKKAVPAPRLAAVFDPLRAQAGEFKKIVSHEQTKDGSYNTFDLLLQFEKTDRLFLLKLTYDSKDRVAGLRITPSSRKVGDPPPAKPDFTKYTTKTDLAFPFEGTWLTVHGGRKASLNHHAGNRNQKYAYDFFILGPNNQSHQGQGEANQDYYAYGQPVIAPGAGVVAQVVDGIEDNQPGKMNPYFVPGNLVVIDHENGEYSFLAHFIPGSIEVEVGDRVRQGQLLGRCGNSGNSSEPHIHYHLANAPLMQDGDGLPAQFRRVQVDGKITERSEPTRGNSVSNPN